MAIFINGMLFGAFGAAAYALLRQTNFFKGCLYITISGIVLGREAIWRAVRKLFGS